MNLQVNTKCFQLSIETQDACTDQTQGHDPGRDEPIGEYSPEYPRNPYDEAGQIHNEVIRKLRKMRSAKPLGNEQILKEAMKMVGAAKFRSPALQSMEKGDPEAVRQAFLKYGIIDGCIPFPWPWLPGLDPFGGLPPFSMPGPRSSTAPINPVELLIEVLKALMDGKRPIFVKKVVTDWENKVMDSRADDRLKENCLVNASIVRYSLALAVEQDNAAPGVQAKVSPWWAVVADGAGGLVGSLGGGLGAIAGAAAASGVADAVIDKANEK